MVTQHQESPQHTHYPGLYSELDGAGTIPWPYGGHGQQRGYVRLGKRGNPGVDADRPSPSFGGSRDRVAPRESPPLW